MAYNDTTTTYDLNNLEHMLSLLGDADFIADLKAFFGSPESQAILNASSSRVDMTGWSTVKKLYTANAYTNQGIMDRSMGLVQKFVETKNALSGGKSFSKMSYGQLTEANRISGQSGFFLTALASLGMTITAPGNDTVKTVKDIRASLATIYEVAQLVKNLGLQQTLNGISASEKIANDLAKFGMKIGNYRSTTVANQKVAFVGGAALTGWLAVGALGVLAANLATRARDLERILGYTTSSVNIAGVIPLILSQGANYVSQTRALKYLGITNLPVTFPGPLTREASLVVTDGKEVEWALAARAGIGTASNWSKALGTAGYALLAAATLVTIGFEIATLCENSGKMTKEQKIAMGFEIGLQAAALTMTTALSIAAAAGASTGPVGIIIGLTILSMLSPVQLEAGVSLINLSNKISDISKQYSNYGFHGYDYLSGLIRAQGALAIVGGIPIVNIFSSIESNDILQTVALKFHSAIRAEYGSFDNFWKQSYAAEMQMMVDEDGFQKNTQAMAMALGGAGTQRLVQLLSTSSNDLQRTLAAIVREGRSLPPTAYNAYVTDLLGNKFNSELAGAIINPGAKAINLTSQAASQYVTSAAVLISPSYEKAQRDSTGKNEYSTSIVVKPSAWSFNDGATSTVLDLNSLGAPRDQKGNIQSVSVNLSMGGGGDTVLAGGYAFSADMGAGFDGVDYSRLFDSGNPSSHISMSQAADGKITIYKSGNVKVAVEDIATSETSYGKRKEKIQYVDTKYENVKISDVKDTLSSVEWIRGTIATDNFWGGAQDNFFIASLGNDSYHGGGGRDWLDYSIFAADRSTSSIGVNASLAEQKAIFATNGVAYTQTLIDIPNLRGTNNTDNLTGDDKDNLLVGGGGSDTIRGGGGNDVIALDYSGSSVVDGGAGIDTLDYSLATATQSIRASLAEAGATFSVAKAANNVDTASGFENIRGGRGNDTLTGNSGNNLLDGNGGNDTINGGAGDDNIITGVGRDLIAGGAGDDTIYVQHGSGIQGRGILKGRYVMIRKNEGIQDFLAVAEVQVMTLGASINAALNKTVVHRDRISLLTRNQASNAVDGKTGGNAAASGIFLGSPYGGGWLQIDLGKSLPIDVINVFGRTDGGPGPNGDFTVYVSDTDMSASTTAQIQTLENVSWFRQEGVGTSPVISFSNRFLDAKTINGGDGADTVDYRYSHSVSGVGIDGSLVSGQVKTWFQNGVVDAVSARDTLTNVENLGGTDAADRLVGDGRANQLAGYGGDDSIDGGAGNDAIVTGTGRDTVQGGAGNDIIYVQHNSEIQGQGILKGRFVMIRKNDGIQGYLSIAEVQVMTWGGLFNAALNKTVNSSGSYSGDGLSARKYQASNVVDGKTAGGAVADGIFASSTEGDGWLQIDLGGAIPIDVINVYGRTDGASFQNGNFTVYVSDTDMSGKSNAQIQATENVSWFRQEGAGTSPLISFSNRFLDAKTINGGDGADTVDYRYSHSVSGVGIDGSLATGQVKTWLQNGWLNERSATDTLANVDNLGGTDAADRLTGSDQSNVLSGYGGDDTIDGGAGDDKIVTGTGRDSVRGGTGNDTIEVAHHSAKIRGRYVMIRKNAGVGNSLTLNEVQVMSGDTNIALNKSVMSSLVRDDRWKASNAVDGKLEGSAWSGGFASIADGARWLQIDIGSSVVIDAIKVYGVTGGGAYNNGDFTVYVSDSDMSAKTTAEIQALTDVWAYRQEGQTGAAFITQMNRFDDAKTINGGDGADTVDYHYSHSVNGVGIDGSLATGQVKTWLQNGVVSQRSATDTLTNVESLAGTDAADRLVGNERANQLTGYAGDDTIDGGAGDDTILTGTGRDSIQGGAGNDTVYVAHESVTKGRYVLIRKNEGIRNYLTLAEVEVMSGGANAARGGNVKVASGGAFDATANYQASNVVDGKTGGGAVADGIYASPTAGGGWLQIDLGSSVVIDAINVYGRTDGPLGQNGDFTVYVSDTDMRAKTAAQVQALTNVWWYRQEGQTSTVSITQMNRFDDAKTIDGGAGADTVDYHYSHSVNGVGIDGSLGTGQVKTWLQDGVVNGRSATDTLTNVENLRGTDATDRLTGNNQSNVLCGYGGDDTIDGGAGDDTIFTGTGRDSIQGGTDDDTIIVEHQSKMQGRYVMIRKNAGVAEYLALAEVQVMSGETNVALNKAVSSSGSYCPVDSLIPYLRSLGLSYLDYHAVDGKIGGGAVADGIFASSTAGGGWLQIDLGRSTAIDAINVYGRTDGSLGQNGDFTVYVSDTDMSAKTTEQILSLQDVAWMRQEGQPTKAIITQMNRLVDAKTINGGDGMDTVDYRSSYDAVSGVGIDGSLLTGRVSSLQNGVPISGSVADTLTNVENLRGTDAADRLTGNDQSNVLCGYGGDDTIDGGAGDDTIFAGTGHDSVLGGAGDDKVFVEYRATDTGTSIDGCGGEDFVSYEASDPGLARAVGIFGSLETGRVYTRFENGRVSDTSYVNTLINVENLGGTNNAADKLVGNSGANALLGYGGDDTLDGGAGNDALCGGVGSDTYVFNTGYGNDAIYEKSADAGTDAVAFGINMNYPDLWFSKLSDGSLKITKVGDTVDSLTVVNNSADGFTVAGGIERYLSGGKTLEASSVDAFVQELARWGAQPAAWSSVTAPKKSDFNNIVATYWR